ncbi:hypothetical protein OC835_004165 [Tilletia horrida]|nr:hypothetical protein OC835_004165 [Tilletia horrida]
MHSLALSAAAPASASSPDLPLFVSTPAGPLPTAAPRDMAITAKRLSTTSSISSSELSQRSRATSGTSGRTRVGSNPIAVRPISHSTSTLVSSSTSSSSRPSSVASNSSQSSTERSSGSTTHALLSPTLLSPALASTLAAGRSAAHGPLSHKRGSAVGTAAAAAAAANGAMGGRRISLPNVPSMMNRVSMVSVASFESLPEDEALSTQSPHSPTFSDSSSSAFSPRSDLRRFPALPPSPRLRSSLGMTESPPTSPDLPRAAPLQPSRQLRPKSSLKRSATEPYGMGKEFDTLMTKRKFVAMELLDTERAYMQSLKLLDENFLKPMQRASIGQPPLQKTSSPCPQLTRKVIAEIFGNFTNIFTLNKELLSQLETRLGPAQEQPTLTAEPVSIQGRPASVASADSNGSAGSSEIVMASSVSLMAPSNSSSTIANTTVSSIESAISTRSASSSTSASTLQGWNPREDLLGDILVPIAPFLSMYKLFAQNFSNSLARIDAERKQNDAFAKFVRAAERAAWTAGPGQVGFGLGFEAHLLTIVQRITRYKMLVGDLVKFTPEGHPDRPELVKAFALVSQIAHDCDDNIRTHEMVLLMLNIQRSLTGLTEPLVVPGRSLLKRGALLKTCRKNIQPREFFLFSDCIVYATPTSGGMESSASAAWQAMVGASLASVWGGAGSAAAEMWGNGSPSLSKRGSAVAPVTGQGQGPATSTPPGSSFGARVRTNSASAAETSSGSSSGAAIMAPLSLQAQSLQFRAKIALQDCTVVSVSSSILPDGLRHSFELRTPEKSFALYAESLESKEDWMTRIREAKEAHMIARRTLKAEEDSIEAKRERRRSLYKDQKSVAASAALTSSSSSSSSLAGLGPAAARASGLRSSIPFGSSSNSISTVREGEPFPTSSSSSFSGVGAEPMDSQSLDGKLSPRVTMLSMSPPTNALGLPRERQRLNSLQSITAALPTPPSLGALLSPTLPSGAATKPLKVVEDYNAPVWVPDSHADKCAVCSDGFGLWRRKHHCRLCGQVVCWNCSQRSFLIPAYQEGAEDQQARACDRCFESMFPPSEDEASPPGSAMPLPPQERLRHTTARVLDEARLGRRAEVGGREEEGEEEQEEGDDEAIEEGEDADQTARAKPMPMLLTSTPTSRPNGGASSTAGRIGGGTGGRPLSVRLDSDGSPASPATPADGAPLLLLPSHASRKSLAQLAETQISSPNSGPGPMGGLGVGSVASPRLFDPATAPALGAGLGAVHQVVTAATSGAGTFRLVTPRLTTPEWEAPPASQASYALHEQEADEGGDDATSVIDKAAVTRPAHRSASSTDENNADYFTGATPMSPAAAAGAPRRKTKKVFSAAARLSSFYGQATAGAAAGKTAPGAATAAAAAAAVVTAATDASAAKK